MLHEETSVKESMSGVRSERSVEQTAAVPSPFRHWHWEQDHQKIVWLHADNADAGTNVLSIAVLEELDAILDQMRSLAPRGLVVLSAKSNGFFAGADIKEFTPLRDESDAAQIIQRGQNVLNKLEALSFPTVALIHGFCLGGGFELALACRYRIADDADSTKIGLPEVQLGLHPGFGGTVRLPALIGAPAAMDVILTGRNFTARNAARMTMIDYAVPTRQLRRAAVETILKPPPPRKLHGWKAWTNKFAVRPVLAQYMRSQTAKKAREEHYPSPYAVIDLWNHHFDDPQRMMIEEAKSLARMATGSTAQNLIRLFFLQERIKGIGKRTNLNARHVHVIGSGVMGGDIAAWCALRGLRVTLQDRHAENIAKVIKRAHGLFTKSLKVPRLVQAAMDRLIPDLEGLGAARADVVIEAIFENIEAKQNLFRDLETKIRADAILATNTSSIPLQVIGEALRHPERLVGLHFFNPVAKMQLVEIVHGPDTDDKFSSAAAGFAHAIGRLPVSVTSTPGFLVNRVLMPYLIEAVMLESEGVPAAVIDKAALNFGMPMGPIQLADTVGLDICLSVAEILSKALGGTVPSRLRELVGSGFLGRKSGRGFYAYKDDKPVIPRIDPGYSPPQDLTDRLMFRMLNECVACLRENVVEDHDLLDAGVIFGTGFAPFRGGPIHYLKQIGVDVMHKRLKDLAVRYGDRFRDDAGWTTL